jgi:hypothetical protein
LLRYLQGTASQRLVFRKLQGPVRVLANADSAFQNLSNARSQAGHIIMIAEEAPTGKQNAVQTQIAKGECWTKEIGVTVISWKSSRHRRIVGNTY